MTRFLREERKQGKKMDLNDYRREMDEIDAQLFAAFERRMDVAGKIAEYKKAHDMPVLDARREKEKLFTMTQEAPEELREYTALL